MNFTVSYILAGIATLLTIFWALLYQKFQHSFDELFLSKIDKKQYQLSELFFIGFGFIELFHINLKTERGRKKEKKVAEIYGEKNAPFHCHVILGGQITYLLTITPFGLYIGALANDIMFAGLILAAAGALVFYLDYQVNNAVTRRRDEILSDFPEMLSKLTLLTNAGLEMRPAWKRVSDSSDGPLYKEMQKTSIDIQNGTPDADAILAFSQRCGIKEIRKFASVVTQNLRIGGQELSNTLRYMTTEAWEKKKHNAKRKGELAGQKLLIPLMLMFVGILIMILVPIVTNMF